ncbi:PH-domain-containing protein [Anaeromyces robustus]|uniref:PH-domain-containing protein n=1 Tax=Anaeromyces robustus TaxID=1754192 RepID=A0A1Y1WZU8_9FUNG|nr:PH-domain-containing protein [Anaeromyces robustus]|eukprot:ORX78716.1 PH-domain-containing protein [Anaeromyces robustus]
MDINRLHQALDELMISSDDKTQKNYPPNYTKRPVNNTINPENYYPNPNNISNKNVNYYTKTVNPNSLASDEYYNDDYYNGDISNNNSNINTPVGHEYYHSRGSSYTSSQGSYNNSLKEKKMRNIEQLKIQTHSSSHSRTQSNNSDMASPRSYTRERRGSQDTMGSSIFSPVSSNCSYSQSSVNEAMTASIKTDISAVTLQTLSFDLVSGYLSRITSSAGFIKSTKRYYFVLDNDGLYYFKTNDPFARAKGFIKFDTRTKIKDIKENSPAKDKSSKLLELEVYKDNKSHQVVLQAEDPEDRDMWHRALKKMIVRQKYVNEALPPLPQPTPQSGTQPIPIPSNYGIPSSPGMRNRSQSQSSKRQSPGSSSNLSSSNLSSSNLSYTQTLKQSQQKLYGDNSNNYEGNPTPHSLNLGKKTSLQNINDINLAAPNIYALQNRRRPSFDIQMLHHQHQRTSSLSSLNEINGRQRYSYGSNQSLGSSQYN